MANATIQSALLLKPRRNGNRFRQLFVQWLVTDGAATGRLEATASVKIGANSVPYEQIHIRRSAPSGNTQRIRATFKSMQVVGLVDEPDEERNDKQEFVTPEFTVTLTIGNDTFPTTGNLDEDEIPIDPC